MLRPERGLLVVDGDDDLDLAGSCGRASVAPACEPARSSPESRLRRYAAGSVTTKAAPPPSALAALTRPPWAATIAGHDREPEPGAALAALAPALGAPEALEQRVRVVGGEAGAVVADLEPDLAVLAADGDVDRAAGGRVHERVADEVAEHLAQLVGVAEHDRGAVGVDARSRGRGRSRGRRATASRGERGRGRPRRAGRRRPRRAAPASAGPRPARPCARPRPRSAASPSRRPRRIARGAHAVQLGVAADRGQRRAQLVRGVGDELAQAVLARLALGERLLEPVEHAVEGERRRGRPRCAGRSTSTRWERSPPAIRPAVWPMRSSGSRLMRTTTQRDGGEHEQDADDHEPLDEDEPVERARRLGERDGDDGDVAGAERARRRRGSASRRCRVPETVIGLPTVELGRDLRRGGRRSARSRRRRG